MQKKCGLSVILDVINLHNVYFCLFKLSVVIQFVYCVVIWPRDFSNVLICELVFECRTKES